MLRDRLVWQDVKPVRAGHYVIAATRGASAKHSAEFKYDFGTTQFNLPPTLAAKVAEYQRTIDPSHLAIGGLETESHITCLYGLHPEVTAQHVKDAIGAESPVRVKFGTVAAFPEGKSGVPLIVPIESPDLHRLNGKVADALPHTDTFPDYVPHLTIAYVVPAAMPQYVGGAGPLNGEQAVLGTITFSDASGDQTDVLLTGKPAADFDASHWVTLEDGRHVEIGGDPGAGALTRLGYGVVPVWQFFDRANENDRGGEGTGAFLTRDGEIHPIGRAEHPNIRKQLAKEGLASEEGDGLIEVLATHRETDLRFTGRPSYAQLSTIREVDQAYPERDLYYELRSPSDGNRLAGGGGIRGLKQALATQYSVDFHWVTLEDGRHIDIGDDQGSAELTKLGYAPESPADFMARPAERGWGSRKLDAAGYLTRDGQIHPNGNRNHDDVLDELHDALPSELAAGGDLESKLGLIRVVHVPNREQNLGLDTSTRTGELNLSMFTKPTTSQVRALGELIDANSDGNVVFDIWGGDKGSREVVASGDNARSLHQALRKTWGVGFAAFQGQGHWVTIDDNPVLIGGEAPSGTKGYEGEHAHETVPVRPISELTRGIVAPAEGDERSVGAQQARLAQALNAPLWSRDVTVAALSQRLSGNAAFNDLAAGHEYLTPTEKQDPGKLAQARADTASTLISQWNVTSADKHPTSLAMQQAVQDEFQLHDASVSHYLSRLGPNDLLDMQTEYATNGPAYRAFARAVYDNTQAELKAQNIDRVLVYRGMNIDNPVARAEGYPGDGASHVRTVTMQPASSWTYDLAIATGFAGHSTAQGVPDDMPGAAQAEILAAWVPSSHIYSTLKTGVGAEDEAEIVLLGGRAQVNMLNVPFRAVGGQIKDTLFKPGTKAPTFAESKPALSIDADLRNADWLKTRSWDIYTKAGVPVRTLAELRAVFPSWTPAQVKGLLNLPVAESMPPELRSEIARAQFGWVTIDGRHILIDDEEAAGATDRHVGGPANVARAERAAALAKLRDLKGSESSREVGQLLSSAVPGHPRTDLDGLDMQKFRPAAVAMAQVAQDYPKAANTIGLVSNALGLEAAGMGLAQIVGSKASAATAVAEGRDGPTGIGFNPSHYGKGVEASVPEIVRGAASTGWAPPEVADSGAGFHAIHEFGHVVDHAIQANPPSVPSWGSRYHPDKVSRYATTGGQREDFAEAFAAYYLGSSHPEAKAMGAFLTEVYGKAPQSPRATFGWVTIDGNHVLIGEDSGSGSRGSKDGQYPMPDLSSREAFYKTNVQLGQGSSSYQEGQRIDALPDDAPMLVYHATDSGQARDFLANGVDTANKPMNLARSRYEAGEYAEYQPGEGVGAGLSVAGTPQGASGYGHHILAIRTRKGDLQPSPEAESRGIETGGLALSSDDAMLFGKIGPGRIFEIGEPRMEPGNAYDEITKALAATGPAPALHSHFAAVPAGQRAQRESAAFDEHWVTLPDGRHILIGPGGGAGGRSGQVTIRREIPANELSDEQLASRLKAQYPGQTVQTLYGRYVQARDLKPRVDAKVFGQMLDLASPNLHVESRSVPFMPTHHDSLTNQLVRVEPTEHGHAITWETGNTGHDPGPLGERYVPLEQATNSATETPVARPYVIRSRDARGRLEAGALGAHSSVDEANAAVEQWNQRNDGRTYEWRYEVPKRAGFGWVTLDDGRHVLIGEDTAGATLDKLGFKAISPFAYLAQAAERPTRQNIDSPALLSRDGLLHPLGEDGHGPVLHQVADQLRTPVQNIEDATGLMRITATPRELNVWVRGKPTDSQVQTLHDLTEARPDQPFYWALFAPGATNLYATEGSGLQPLKAELYQRYSSHFGWVTLDDGRRVFIDDTTAEARSAMGQVPQTKGDPHGDGSLKNPLYVDGDLVRAATAIQAGQHVRLDQPEQVSTLIDKLGAMAQDAQSKGEKAPYYDLGLVEIPGTNLFTMESKGISRIDMPQLQGATVPDSPAAQTYGARANLYTSFRDELGRLGYTVTEESVPAANLRATQLDLNGVTVAQVMQRDAAGKLPDQRIFVTQDHYILDGHHRWAAKVGADLRDNTLGDISMPVATVNTDIGTMLDLTRIYAGAMGITQNRSAGSARTTSFGWVTIDGRHVLIEDKGSAGGGRRAVAEKGTPPSYVKQVVDSATAKPDDNALGNAGWVEDGVIKGIHVTSDPERAAQILEQGKPLVDPAVPAGDIGPGLYMSATPQLWTGRAPGKWEFLKTLNTEQRQAMADQVMHKVNQPYSGIAGFEKEYLARDLNDFVAGKNDYGIISASEQPFNVQTWHGDFLKPLGIQQNKPPSEVPMAVSGKFAELTGYPTPDQVTELRQRYDGAFMPGGMITYPQLVVWNNSAVQRFGSYTASAKHSVQFEAGHWITLDDGRHVFIGDSGMSARMGNIPYFARAQAALGSPQSVQVGPETLQSAQAMIGKPISAAQLAELTLSPAGGIITQEESPPGETAVKFHSSNPSQPDVESTVTMWREDGQLVVNDNYLTTRQRWGSSDTPPGYGTALLARQIDAARAVGAGKITLQAAGEGTGVSGRHVAMNGYYTWARLGFNGNVPHEVLAHLGHDQPAPQDMNDLIIRGGAPVLKQYGESWMGTFDLSPASRSSQILTAYLEEHTRSATHSWFADGVADAPPLSAYEEALLDAAMERLRHRLGLTPVTASESTRFDGGHWVTIDGNHVMIGANGQATKGPPALVKAINQGKLKRGQKVQVDKSAHATEEAKQALREVPKTKGEPEGDGSLQHPIAAGKDLNLAMRLMAEGKHIRLDQPDQVSTLLDKVAANVVDARAKGEKAPDYDLGLVTVPGTNLFTMDSKGISRAEMPQLSGKPRPGSPAAKIVGPNGEADLSGSMLASLQEIGVKVTPENVAAAHLRATQMDLNGAKVAGMAKAMKAGEMPEQPIFVTRDNYVIDGHHRWAAKVGIDVADNKLGDVKMPVYRVDMDIGAAIDYSRSFAAKMGIPQAKAFSLFRRALNSLVALFQGGDEHWVTIDGQHVLIGSGGKIVAGGEHLGGSTAGKGTPTDKKPWPPRGERNAATLAMDEHLHKDLGVYPNRSGDPPPATLVDRKTGELYDVKWNQFGNPEEQAHTRRPLDYVYRSVSGEDLAGIRQKGYMQSDQRMNLSSAEGTVAKTREPAPFYLPEKGPGAVLKIKVEPQDKWRIDSDEYAKTNEKIPLDRIVAVSHFLNGEPATEEQAAAVYSAAFGWVTLDDGHHVFIEEGGRHPTLESLHIAPTEAYRQRAEPNIEANVKALTRQYHGLTAEDVKANANENVRSFLDGVQVKMHMPYAAFAKVFAPDGTGHFENQIESGTTRGDLDQGLRNSVEDQAFGLAPATHLATNPQGADNHPKYGYLEHPGSTAGNMEFSGYGSVEVTFKPEVLDRTTVVFGDSLRGLEAANVLPMPVKSATYQAVNSSSLVSLGQVRMTPRNVEQQSGYVEAQIHGPNLNPNDVASVRFINYPDYMENEVGERASPEHYVNLARQAGVRVEGPLPKAKRSPLNQTVDEALRTTHATPTFPGPTGTIGAPIPAGRFEP